MTKPPPPEYWFARRFPIGNVRGGMAPINWKGYLVVFGFFVGLCIGGAAFAWFAMREEVAKGAIVFAGCAIGAGIWFINMAHRKGDHVHTVADYREGRVRV